MEVSKRSGGGWDVMGTDGVKLTELRWTWLARLMYIYLSLAAVNGVSKSVISTVLML